MSNKTASINIGQAIKVELEQPTELYLKKILAGDVESVRLQLIDAMESLGYDVLEEQPHIVGRREAKDWGAWSASTNILEYGRTLTIRLKPVSESSTQVTFDYLIRYGSTNKGDKRVILQEAETIAAISKMQAIEKLCPVCETESTDDSKFCRRCGAPLTSERAEIEVLRMMAETRAGKASVATSTILTTISSLVLIFVLVMNSAGLVKEKLFPLLLILTGGAFILGLVSNYFGWNRLNRALEKPESTTPRLPRSSPKTIETETRRELPPQRQAPASVTEGTTNLLDEQRIGGRKKEKVRLADRRTTQDLD